MAILRGDGSTGISSIRDTIGNNGSRLGAYYKTPTGPTPTSYANVPTSGTIKYSQFRGGVTTTPDAPQTSTGQALFGGGTIPAFLQGQQPNNTSTVADYYGKTPPEGYSPIGVMQPFVIPQYTEIHFEISGAGGSSGESIWDPSDVIPRACVANGIDGNSGQASFLFPPNGAVTQPAVRAQTGFAHTSGAFTAYIYDGVKTNGTEIVFAGGGTAGKGAQWTGGCDGRKGGGTIKIPGDTGGGGINPGFADSRDKIDLQGGAGGGGGVPYYTSPGTEGGQGGRGTLVSKWFQRGGQGSPIPGDTWLIYLGYNNPLGGNGGGWFPGFPSWCYIYWK